MPVIRSAPPPAHARDELVRRLADELAAAPGANPNGEPLIFENPLPPTDRLFVVVVWSAWEQVLWGERPRVIADAYRECDATHPDQPPRTPSLAIPTGLTWSEADSNAYFKFAVEPAARAGEVNPDEVRRAMLDEGGYATPSGVKLRFMLRHEAEVAYNRLREKLPAAYWGLSELVRSRD